MTSSTFKSFKYRNEIITSNSEDIEKNRKSYKDNIFCPSECCIDVPLVISSYKETYYVKLAPLRSHDKKCPYYFDKIKYLNSTDVKPYSKNEIQSFLKVINSLMSKKKHKPHPVKKDTSGNTELEGSTKITKGKSNSNKVQRIHIKNLLSVDEHGKAISGVFYGDVNIFVSQNTKIYDDTLKVKIKLLICRDNIPHFAIWMSEKQFDSWKYGKEILKDCHEKNEIKFELFYGGMILINQTAGTTFRNSNLSDFDLLKLYRK